MDQSSLCKNKMVRRSLYVIKNLWKRYFYKIWHSVWQELPTKERFCEFERFVNVCVKAPLIGHIFFSFSLARFCFPESEFCSYIMHFKLNSRSGQTANFKYEDESLDERILPRWRFIRLAVPTWSFDNLLSWHMFSVFCLVSEEMIIILLKMCFIVLEKNNTFWDPQISSL